ncbi:MAG: hypothetical protein CM1200mP30_02330 [Pseudomonadota bacterium]|nr:MAG: hypothetical protein CM1200mP30_02330 [Pseudomonadota bacterium]
MSRKELAIPNPNASASDRMLGCFAAMDVVLFYVFFEVMLIPMYLLIGIWGGSTDFMLPSNSFYTHFLVLC